MRRKWKIVVLQKASNDLNSIKATVRVRNPELYAEIIWAFDTSDVMDAISDQNPAIIISSQILNWHGSERIRFGTDLAMAVKEINPEVMFFIYSTLPDRNDAVDGVIPKGSDDVLAEQHLLLARILCSVNDETTVEGIKQMFPEVK